MTESKICTCPSGDGSLRWPCPAHPAVDQADVAAKLTFINGRPAMCGCQVEYSDGGGEYSDVIYVTLCAKHSGSAILDLVATNRIALTPEYEGQWHADLYLDREIPLAKVEGATPAEAVIALMSAERIDPEQESVEQAGGDRWDALQSILEWTASENIPDERKLCLIRNAARAALAQPSPVRSSLLINGYQLRAALDFIAPDGTAEQLESEACIEWRQQDADFLEAGLYAFCAEYPEEGGVLLDEEPTTAQPSPLQSEQAEAERPEVVAVVRAQGFGRVCEAIDADTLYQHCSEGEPLMTVAQHERIVGAPRYKAELYDEVWALVTGKGYMNVTTAISVLESERDAALARVAELERQEPVATVAKVPGEDWNSLDFHRDLQHMQPGTKLYAAPVAQAQQLHDLDKQCRDDVARALGLRPNQERGFAWSYLLASIKSCVKASEDSAQAQHSVPEGLAEFSQFLSAVMDAAGLVRYGRRSKELSEYLGAQCMKYRLSAPVAQAQHSVPEKVRTLLSRAQCEIEHLAECLENVCEDEEDFDVREDVADGRVVAADIAHMLAAAPDKEVPQAWLDVQAERRRQVEAEGYHGFRDSHYISYELSKAARAYIEVSWHALSGGLPCKKPESWPWMAGFKWSDGRTMLVKAAALTLAEIERLDRAAPGKEGV
ncbi:hypothetical protein [Pseudomonas aeruginosa]|uniref:hypothetical protein n=1 Tax=Pseudomonas aeruginosa TaxID=287 RepID=UPI0018FF2172|nr:hypothetical protein [Pseudomonas aeruginosa]MBH4486802.1 hypothetical protein [Pseudomonas aeruginosa]MBH4526989.1 hypothetical protein [Pseudomonas aeruginosa]HDP3382744.1 hypothetical protein [Pseudomonas aeruginosa]